MVCVASRARGIAPIVVACAVVLSITAAGRNARAEGPDDNPDPRALWGPAAGALTALVPLAVGGTLLAHDHEPDLQRAGIFVIAFPLLILRRARALRRGCHAWPRGLR